MTEHICDGSCIPWCQEWKPTLKIMANLDRPEGDLIAAGGWQAPTQYFYPTPDIHSMRGGFSCPTQESEPAMDRLDIIEKLDAIADQMTRGLRRGQDYEVETLLHGIRAIDALAHKLRSEVD